MRSFRFKLILIVALILFSTKITICDKPSVVERYLEKIKKQKELQEKTASKIKQKELSKRTEIVKKTIDKRIEAIRKKLGSKISLEPIKNTYSFYELKNQYQKHIQILKQNLVTMQISKNSKEYKHFLNVAKNAVTRQALNIALKNHEEYLKEKVHTYFSEAIYKIKSKTRTKKDFDELKKVYIDKSLDTNKKYLEEVGKLVNLLKILKISIIEEIEEIEKSFNTKIKEQKNSFRNFLDTIFDYEGAKKIDIIQIRNAKSFFNLLFGYKTYKKELAKYTDINIKASHKLMRYVVEIVIEKAKEIAQKIKEKYTDEYNKKRKEYLLKIKEEIKIKEKSWTKNEDPNTLILAFNAMEKYYLKYIPKYIPSDVEKNLKKLFDEIPEIEDVPKEIIDQHKEKIINYLYQNMELYKKFITEVEEIFAKHRKQITSRSR